MFVVTLLVIAPNWKQPQYPSTSECMLYAKTDSNDIGYDSLCVAFRKGKTIRIEN